MKQLKATVKYFAFALLFLVLKGEGFASSLNCLAIVEEYKESGLEHYSELQRVAKLLGTVDVDILTGKRNPEFSDIAVLEQIDEILSQTSRFLGPAYEEVFAKIRQAFSSGVASDGVEAFDPDYSPNRHELRLLYESVWNRMVSDLPPQLSLPQIHISQRAAHREKIINEGRSVVRNAGRKFDELFPATSGVSSFDAYMAQLKAMVEHDSGMKSNFDIVESQGEVIIQRPQNARWWIEKIGLHNQHVTGTSGGYQGKSGRNAVEATSAAMDLAAYMQLDDTAKPVYGHLVPAQGSSRQGVEAHYGPDSYVLDTDKLHDRITLTMGDSLNRADAFVPHWRRGGSSTPTSWDHLFIPWRSRQVITAALGKNELFTFVSSPQIYTTKARIGTEYVEAQIHGGSLDFSVIRAFEFKGTPPSGSFLRNLRKQGVEIRDRRKINPGTRGTIWEDDLEFSDLKVIQNDALSEGKPLDVQRVSIREVRTKDQSLDPWYEWVVDVVTKADLGDYTTRLKLVDVANLGRRINPSARRIDSDSSSGTFVYQIRVPRVRLAEHGRLYVELPQESGQSLYSNQGRPDSYFEVSSF